MDIASYAKLELCLFKAVLSSKIYKDLRVFVRSRDARFIHSKFMGAGKLACLMPPWARPHPQFPNL